MNPKILLIDDDPAVLLTYEETLGDVGLPVHKVTGHEEARAALRDDGPWDVVVLDEKVRGPGGPASAAAFLPEIASLDPAARTIVITGFATPALARAAVEAGAWDYLQKDAELLFTLLPLRVRNAVEAARERRLRGASPEEIERRLRETWERARRGEEDANTKGRLLEEALLLLFRTLPGLSNVTANRRGIAEEFDLVVRNESDDALLSKEGSFFLVECKNWSKKVGAPELTVFAEKLRARFGRVRLGILVAVGGFTEGVRTLIASRANESGLVVLIDGDELDGWISSADRLEWLKGRIEQAALRQPGR